MHLRQPPDRLSNLLGRRDDLGGSRDEFTSMYIDTTAIEGYRSVVWLLSRDGNRRRYLAANDDGPVIVDVGRSDLGPAPGQLGAHNGGEQGCSPYPEGTTLLCNPFPGGRLDGVDKVDVARYRRPGLQILVAEDPR
jgi:hypothetical protein